MDAYRTAYETVEDAGDSVTADALCDYLGDVQSIVGKLETFLGQIEEIGLSEFLGQKL
jgi:bacterioferritin (cytochrome b1)